MEEDVPMTRDTVRRFLWMTVVAVVLGSGCDEDKGDGSDAGNGTGVDCDAPLGEGDPVPIAVDCSYYYDGEQIDVTYEVSETNTETPVGDKLIARAALSDSEYDGRSFSVRIFAEDGTVGTVAIYQMGRTCRPKNEFWGDHGFTGLSSVKDPDSGKNVQYACFARDPADPPHRWQD
jgi:hypothetical protein